MATKKLFAASLQGSVSRPAFMLLQLAGVALRTNPTAGVTEIARDWGFWHQGDFDTKYRREFGEQP